MFLKSILLLAALAVSILAAPLNITKSNNLSPSLHKRATPQINRDDYTKQEIAQIKQAHNDAILMASTVLAWSTSPPIFDPIFKKYFNIADRDGVLSIFKQIVGPKDDGHGHGILGDITAVADWIDEDEDEPSCTEGTDAELRGYDTDNPWLVVCPRGLKLGAIGKSWPGAPAVTCDTFFPRISRKMNTLGFVLLHEYTHWETLMSPVMLPAFEEKATLDEAIGAWKVRRLKRHPATWNADSYAWLAQEVWWTQSCRNSHGESEEPERGDN